MTSASDATRRRVRLPLSRRIPRQYWAATIVLLAGVNVIVWWFLVRPLAAQEAEAEAAAVAAEAALAAKAAEVDRLREVASKVETARNEGDGLIESILLERRTTFSTLVDELDQSAKEAGVALGDRSYEIEPIDGAEEYGMIKVIANFEGEYANLVRLLNVLDRNERFLVIESLAATPQRDSEALNISLAINTFSREGGS